MRIVRGWPGLLLFGAVVLVSGPAFAGGSQGPLADATVEAHGVTTRVSQEGMVTQELLLSSVLDQCEFFPDLAPSEVLVQLETPGFADRAIPADSVRYTMVVCPDPVFDGARHGFWPVGSPIPDPVVEFLGREAVARAEVAAPTPRGAPDGVTIPHLVQLPTWWWLDDADWRQVSGTAALGQPALASVTAVLSPIEAIWQIEGEPPVVCGQGAVWAEGRSDDDPSRCGTIFESITPEGGVTQTVTLRFDISFTCAPTALCTQLPTFEPLEISSTTQIQIIQSKGLLRD